MNCENSIIKKQRIEVYSPCNLETGIRGFWLDDNGKLFDDNILIQSVNPYQFQRIKHNLFKRGELAVFYVENENAFIETKGGIEKLTTRKRQTIYNPITEKQTKALVEKYGGFTLFKNVDDTWIIEVWTK
ncbi:MAG: hypothetical protein ACTSWG_10590 [Candidatus Helarchaeota archaeon]